MPTSLSVLAWELHSGPQHQPNPGLPTHSWASAHPPLGSSQPNHPPRRLFPTQLGPNRLKHKCVCVCVCLDERASVPERIHMWVCVCKRESVCVFECGSVYISI